MLRIVSFIVLLLCQYSVMGQVISHDMLSKQLGPGKVQALALHSKLPVTVFSLHGCPPCMEMEQQVKGNEEYDFKFVKDPNQHPEWLYEFMGGKGWSFPVLYWQSHEGDWKVGMWGGLDYFRKQYPPKKLLNVEVGAEFAPTPSREVERVLNLLPKPEVGFVDFGCGDARWCIAAVERWGCHATGIEIDSMRAKVARERVSAVGMSHLITIIEGDATKVDVQADVGVAYLWPDVLEQLKPRLERLQAFASYMHRPPGLPVIQNGDTWLYVKPQQVTQFRSAVWQGQMYSGPVCNSPGCNMCNAIRKQLSR